MTAPGDKVAFEQLTYSLDLAQRQPDRPAQRADRRLTSTAPITPEDFERLCAQQHPKLVFLMPSLHNPTLAIMPRPTAAGDRRDRPQVQCLADRGRHLRRNCSTTSRPLLVAAGAGAHLPCRQPVEDGRGRRARRLGVLPGQFRAARADRAQDGDRRHAVPARRTRRPAGAFGRGRRDPRQGDGARSRRAKRSRAGFGRPRLHLAPARAVPVDEAAGALAVGHLQEGAGDEGVLVDDEDEYKAGRTERVFHRIRVAFLVPPTARRTSQQRLFHHSPPGRQAKVLATTATAEPLPHEMRLCGDRLKRCSGRMRRF